MTKSTNTSGEHKKMTRQEKLEAALADVRTRVEFLHGRRAKKGAK
jgi:hypothetical protein